MANNKSKVYLGFEDELITQKCMSLVNYTTNKAGGKPDWIENKLLPNPRCQLCGLTLPLIVQIYAPLEKSLYHRTLYIFGCVNPNCWNRNESWVCLRGQLLDTATTESVTSNNTVENFDWCGGANDWEDEENGNVVRKTKSEMECVGENVNLNIRLAELNLDFGVEVDSAMAAAPVVASAEIEGEEGEAVTIDTPTVPEVDLTALLDQAKPLPQVPSETLEFVSFFISVCEEDQSRLPSPLKQEIHHLQSMLVVDEPNSVTQKNAVGVDTNGGDSMEKYEKTLPAHGDKLFHQFISRIQRNPGQLLRYIRDGGSPLLLSPARDVPRQCQHCGGSLVCELQLLPTLISRLQLEGSGLGHLEYGTVLVLTCQQSCWAPQDSVRSECVLVQREV